MCAVKLFLILKKDLRLVTATFRLMQLNKTQLRSVGVKQT